jgi:hypothetical protein
VTRAEELARRDSVAEMIVRRFCAHAAPRQPEVTLRTVSAARDDD